MRVGLVTEGTYPINTGGVSRWCDQLVRGMPDVEFELVALSGSGSERLAYDLPDNVVSLHRVGLWAPTRRPIWIPRGVLHRFTGAYEPLLTAVLVDSVDAHAQFAASIESLAELARSGYLTAVLRSQAAVDVLVSVWNRHVRPHLRPGERDLPLADMLAITDLIEHHLRPLSLPPLEVDLVHATANGPSTMFGLTSRWAHGTPVLMSEHGVYLRERVLSIRATGADRMLRSSLIRFFVRLTELGYRAADRILPVSEFNGRWARSNGARATSVRTVHNGVHPGSFPRAMEEPDVPTLSFVGRIDPLKDIEMLVRAVGVVRRSVPDVRLRLFGPVPAGNEKYADTCEKLVSDLGLGDCVTFEGPISPVSAAYAAGHVVVLSSLSEGLPLSIIEAAMSGRATVATDVGGVGEAVGGGGILVPAGDVSAFAAACVRVLTDAPLRHRLADAGHDRARRSFTLDRMVDTTRGLYRETVDDALGIRPGPALAALPTEVRAA